MRDVDILIVGGGIIGVATAYAIAKRTSDRIVLLEAESSLGSGATAKGTGGMRHQFSSEVNVRLTQLSFPVYERFEAEFGQSIGLRRHGYLLVTSRAEVWEELRRSVAMQQALGVPSRIVTPAQAADLFPHLRVDDLRGGSYCPLDGSASPTDAALGFAAQARSLGVTFRLGEHVERVLVSDGRVVGVSTSTGEYRARVVVNAAGPAAAALAKTAGIDLPARPFRRQVFVAPPIEWLPHGLPMLVDLDTGWYVHQEAAGTLLLGGTDATTRPGMVEEVDWDAFHRVAEAVAGRVPQMADALRIHSAYCGIRTVTPDHLPILGPVRGLSGYISATACNGHGFMHAPAVGLLLAESIVDGGLRSVTEESVSLHRFEGALGPTEAVVF